MSAAENLNLDQGWREIFPTAPQKAYPAKTILGREGDPIQEVKMVVSGVVLQTSSLTSGSPDIIHGLRGTGDLLEVEELALEDSSVCRRYTSVVQNQCAAVIRRIGRASFDEAMETLPGLRTQMLRNMFQRILRHQAELVILKDKQVKPPKFNRILRLLVQRFGVIQDGQYVLRLPLNFQQLANFAGTSPTNCSRMLGGLNKKGEVRVERKGMNWTLYVPRNFVEDDTM